MIVNTNIASMNAQKSLLGTNNAMQKSLEKLSSGSRINKAADDAAGLAMSEKMRGQIKGLNQAVRNAQSAISLTQTAEGALNETHSILQRMRELAVQSASDTNTTDDRAKIQAEMDQLAKEVSRISNTTEFNTQNLLAGNLDNTFHIGANAGQKIDLAINAMDAKSLAVTRDTQSASLATSGTSITAISLAANTVLPSGTTAITAADVAAQAAASGAVDVDGGTATLTVTASTANGEDANGIQIKLTNSAADAAPTATASGNIITVSLSTDATDNNTAGIQAAIRGLNTVDGVDVSQWTAVASENIAATTLTAEATTGFLVNKTTAGITAGINFTANNAASGTNEVVKVATNATSVAFSAGFNGLTLTKNAAATVAANVGTTNITVATTASAAATFLNGVQTDAVAAGGINVTTQVAADSAITVIDKAINTVSEERSKLGAMQNRLEHTINNLQTASENMTSAESRIRDVDMAAEMSNFTKSQILSQAGVAMLAQANQVPQAVLKLLG